MLKVDDLLECITVELNIGKDKHIQVSWIYRTPNTSINSFSDELENILNVGKGEKVFLCGDVIIDLLKHEDNNNSKKILDLLYSVGFYPLIYINPQASQYPLRH